jgi:phenylpropionate dioxygenase-like ring-hydroxylating dioxygenase large terminal subunit
MMNNMTPIAELKASVAVPFEQARSMPKSVYTSEEFAAAEVEQIFKKEWFCVGRASTMANYGDYIAFELAGQPLMVIREKDGTLRAQSNVCLHRMSTLLQGSGRTSAIVCPYHGWTYNLDGSLRAAAAMTHNDGFRKADYCLPQVRCTEWLGWIMVTLNPDVAPVHDVLADVEALIDDYDMTNYVENFQERFTWNTNWKVLAENFMESYHLPVCHAKTIGGLSKLDEMVCPTGKPSFNHHTILKDDTLKIGLAHPNNTRMIGERRRTTFLLSVYPSLLITLTPGYFWYLSLHPRGAAHVDVIFGGGMADDFAADPDAQQHFSQLKSLLDVVNVEDKGCTERVYRGLCSDLAQPGHLSHLERPNFEFATYIASMFP